jgi:hypothetical protein
MPVPTTTTVYYDNIAGELTLSDKLELLIEMKCEIAPQLQTIKDLETEIKEEVLATGEIPQAEGAKVTIRSGYRRASWDTKALEGFAAAHPEILVFKQEKAYPPSVSIRIGL